MGNKYINSFERYEKKYLISLEQKDLLQEYIQKNMIEDEYGETKIQNIYYDTPSFLLIRNSLDRPIYKEKLRLRSYGEVEDSNNVFIEIKKKFKNVVYKRREKLNLAEALAYLNNGKKPNRSSQIFNEIDSFIGYYKSLESVMYLSYDRCAFFGKENRNFRITFDKNIKYSSNNFALCKNDCKNEILERKKFLMEVKTSDSIPIDLSRLLSEFGIYPTSFSKYGRAYLEKFNYKEKVIEKI